MYKKTITYTDYNGVERKEDFYFNLNRAELTKLELSKDGGYASALRRIIDANDGPTIMDTFDKILRMAYGVKSDDGRRFMKSEQISNEFAETPAYDALFMELCTDSKASADFVMGIVPPDVAESAQPNVIDMVRANK